VVLCVVVAAILGSIESLIARLKLKAVPQYILVALIAGGIALLTATFRIGGQG
jgi:hypothetical protein